MIIIDHGTISFDGQLSAVIDRFSDYKLITIQLAQNGTSENALSRFGELVEQTPESIKLKVKKDRVISACKELLDQLPVTDIDIQEVPIEDVIGQIFSR